MLHFYCLIHQQALLKTVTEVTHIESRAVKRVNFIRVSAVNHR
jgi:hypothetical protein